LSCFQIDGSNVDRVWLKIEKCDIALRFSFLRNMTELQLVDLSTYYVIKKSGYDKNLHFFSKYEIAVLKNVKFY
jgi:hypothetical protein